jgi:Fe-S oxidoreductase/FAD/FMN-containing dehydrogenase
MAGSIPAGTVEMWNAHRMELEKSITGKVADTPIQTQSYASNAGIFELQPLAVITPEHEGDIAAIMKFCSAYGLPVTARGSGTSVTDAAVGCGIIVDLGRKMNTITSIDLERNEVDVQAGMTIEALNSELSKYGKMLPLYPLKGRGCTVGGCIGINAGGFLSARYGRMDELIISLRAVLHDGSVADCGAGIPSRGSPLPDEAAAASRADSAASIFAGSEGKIGIIVSARLKLVDVPRKEAVCAYFFRSIGECTTQAAASKLSGCTSAIFADSLIMSSLSYRLGSFPFPREADGCIIAVAPEEQSLPDPGILGAMSSARLNEGTERLFAAFVDSIHTLSRPVPNGRYAVMIEGFRMGAGGMNQFCKFLLNISDEDNVHGIMFGDAIEGTVYFRPFLNMTDERDRRKHASILGRAAEYAHRLNPGVTSENGLGLLLSSRFSENGSACMRRIAVTKAVMDPRNVLNPAVPAADRTELPYRAATAHGGEKGGELLNWHVPDIQAVTGRGLLNFGEEVNACHGCGECRTVSYIETQCPVYKAIGGEITSPRGRNNLVRLVKSGRPDAADITDSGEYATSIFDYCVQCKMCVIECPSNVNTAKIMMEARAQFIRRAGVKKIGRASKFFSDYEFYTVVASSVASLSNRLITSRKARSLLEHAFGIDRRRRIPEFDSRTFSEWFSRHEAKQGRKGVVAYYSDIYANYFDSAVGIAAVELLERAGYSVIYPRQRFTGLPLIYLGMIREARRYVFDNASFLFPYTSKGMRIVCSSPSAVMALRHDYLSILADDRAMALSKSVTDITELLHECAGDGGLRDSFAPLSEKIYYFPCCHARALGNHTRTKSLLELIPEAEVEMLQEGCCGAGGSYGFAKETFSMSMDMGSHLFGVIASKLKNGGILVTDGEECALHIRQGTGIRATLPVKVLAAQLTTAR